VLKPSLTSFFAVKHLSFLTAVFTLGFLGELRKRLPFAFHSPHSGLPAPITLSTSQPQSHFQWDAIGHYVGGIKLFPYVSDHFSTANDTWNAFDLGRKFGYGKRRSS
jgi:hypothetical protein